MRADLSRRQALVVVAATTACACCGDASAEEKKDEKPLPKSLTIGKLSDFAAGFDDRFLESKVLVSRLEDRLVVMTAICTHKRCVVKPKPDDASELLCKCHKGQYSSQGTPISGPPKHALVRYAVRQEADGTIVADLTRSFEERQWDDKAAFIPVAR